MILERKGVKLANRQKPKKFDKAQYDAQFMRDKVMKLTVYLNRDRDSDVINRLNEQPSKSSYIKRLIRKDISDQ